MSKESWAAFFMGCVVGRKDSCVDEEDLLIVYKSQAR